MSAAPVLPISDPQALLEAQQIIRSGGLIAFPTDTVYGIGCSAFNKEGVERIYRTKQRSRDLAIPILIGNLQDLEQIVLTPSGTCQKLITAFWPGALTLIVFRQPDLPSNLAPGSTIGIRMPDWKATLDLLQITGPLATTSANLSGQPSGLNAGMVGESLGNRIDLILDGGHVSGKQPSTVIDCSGEESLILREGPITRDQILAVLSKD